MSYPRLRTFVGLLFGLAVLLAGCALPPPPPLPTPPPGEAAAEPSPEPIVVTDGLGRQVTLPEIPQRIVSLAPSNSEILFAVGAEDQVVGVTQFCNYPPEACADKEVVGGFSAKSISVEVIVSLEPDLVLSRGEIHRPIIEALEQQGIPVIALTGRSFEEVYADIQQVGQVTGHPDQAEQVVAAMQARVAQVTEAVADIPQEERLQVFYEVWDEPLMTAGPNTFIGQMIDLAGGINIFGDVAEDYPVVSSEEVIRRNPDVILAPDTHAEKVTPEALAQRPGWETIQAVQEGRIHLVDGDIVSRPGPRIVDGLEAVARALYPERFP